MSTKLFTQKEIKRAGATLEAHAADIGHVVMEWNTLHDSLGELFVDVIGSGQRTVLLAAWQAVPNDRSKRAMLKAAALELLEPEHHLYQEIKWLCGTLDALEDRRNDAIHTPFGVTMTDGIPKVVPRLWTGSPRAQKLKDKDVRIELQSYANRMRLLTAFVNSLMAAYRPASSHTWPERPQL